MTSILKSTSAYKTIGEVARELDLVNNKNGTLQTYTLRFWEKQFRQIKPSIRAGGRRYYSPSIYKLIKYVKFLLKERGLTINGAKKILNNPDTDTIDDNMYADINRSSSNNTKLIKKRIENISRIIKQLKKIK